MLCDLNIIKLFYKLCSSFMNIGSNKTSFSRRASERPPPVAGPHQDGRVGIRPVFADSGKSSSQSRQAEEFSYQSISRAAEILGQETVTALP